MSYDISTPPWFQALPESDQTEILAMCKATHDSGGDCQWPPTESDLAGARAAWRFRKAAETAQLHAGYLHGLVLSQRNLDDFDRKMLKSCGDLLQSYAAANIAPTVMLTERQRLAVGYLLTRIGSWTSSRFDQHLRHDVGDRDADAILVWLSAQGIPTGGPR